jgi:putative membrane protein
MSERSFGLRVLAYVLAAAVAALTIGSISAQRLIAYESQAAIFIFAILLGLMNATIKPVLQLVALPLTCLTFGLFALLLNAALFGLAAALTPGMRVSFWGAIIGAIITSLASGIIYSWLDEHG